MKKTTTKKQTKKPELVKKKLSTLGKTTTSPSNLKARKNYSQNETATNNEDSLHTYFDKTLSFSLFYNFTKAYKQYIFSKKMPQNNCLCKVCENTSLMEKGLRQSCKPKDIPMDPHSVVEHYLYDLDLNDYTSLYSECKHDGLSVDDFDKDDNHEDESDECENEQSEGSDTDFEDGVRVKYYQWKKGDDGHLSAKGTQLLNVNNYRKSDD